MDAPISYRTAVTALREHFPEFVASSEKWYDDLPNDAFGTFALFLCRCIDQGCSEAFLTRAFEFFNTMAESSDDEVVNLLEVAVLEIRRAMLRPSISLPSANIAGTVTGLVGVQEHRDRRNDRAPPHRPRG